MILDFTQEDGVVRAVAQTFSGENPCEMCQFIETMEMEDRPQGPLLPDRTGELREIKLLLLAVRHMPQPVVSYSKTQRNISVCVPQSWLKDVSISPLRAIL